jgi:hypothetical protein
MDLIYCDNKGNLFTVYFGYFHVIVSYNYGKDKIYSYENAAKRLNKMHLMSKL